MNERDLQRLVDDAPDVIARFDRGKRTVYVNRAIETATGRPPAAFLGKRCSELDLPGDFARVWEEALDKVFATGALVELEFVLPDATHFPRTYHARLVPQGDGVAGYARDVTAIRPAAGLHAQLVQETSDAVLVADDDRRYVDANPAASELLGVPGTELLGTRIEDYAAGPFDVREAWKAFLTTGKLEGEFPLRRRDGTTRIVDYRARANFQPGRHLSILRDITERKAAEKELARANEERAKLLETLELYLAILGHDLRNPLAAIALAAHALENGKEVSDRGKTVVARVRTAVRRATRLVDQLLDMTRIRSGAGLPMAPGPADLAQIARRAVEELGAKEVRLEVSGNTSGVFDEDRLAQLAGNLLANAMAHGEEGSAVDVAVHGDAAMVELAISNRGTPIPAAVQDILFEPFRKQEGSPGLGLGLYICAEIARAHGGTLTVSSNERDGTTFRLTIPR